MTTWTGSNAFRLMPTDAAHDAVATAEVTEGAGGNLVSLAYTWLHPDDGAQDGLLVLGPGPDGSALALWGDSWHQTPEAQVLAGSVEPGVWSVGYDYVPGQWRWRIVVDTSDAEELLVRMENVALDDEIPPYAAMDLRVHPA
ncbi:hypothetical protein ACFQ46_11645 [Kineococcus sp. GCM10028916]|uniref:hypothetical protein n=1 Tax=Kineococcus sp. GCM10028916 TaxID=3273394 RepID=UPI003635DC7D